MHVLWVLPFPVLLASGLSSIFPANAGRGAARKKYDKVSIFLLNFFLGWSLIGWIVGPGLGMQE